MTLAARVFFPLDKQLGLVERNWSEGLVKQGVWLSGRAGSYAEAAEIFERIGRVAVSDSTLWRQVEKRGEALRQAAAAQQAQAMAAPQVGERPRQPAAGAERMGVAMDGAMVNVRVEGWKELKVGTVYEIGEEMRQDRETQEWQAVARATDNSYVAHLGGPADFGERMWTEAQSRGWEAARTQQTIGDGAKWIWNLADEHFFLSQRTVDWYHATQHLHEVAQQLYLQNQRAATRWYNRSETLLFQGQAETIAEHIEEKLAQSPDLPSAVLRAQATYFRTNHKRMQYMSFREEGLPIGSGMVESAAKQFKARFTGPGMRWSRDGLQRLLPVRAAILSGSFDDLWHSTFSPALN